MRINVVLTACCLFISLSASAVDGVREINQTCAVNTGCFAGDAAGFPVTIKTSGSYVLTSSLTVSTDVDGISAGVNDVALDLNGFTVTGFGLFSSTKDGIAGPDGFTLSDGRVTGFRRGVALGLNAIVDSVIVRDADVDTYAITVGGRSSVRNCAIDSQSADGISAGGLSVIENNRVFAATGIFISNGTLRGNTISANDLGLGVTGMSQVTDNAVRSESLGMSLSSDSGYSNNSVIGGVSGGIDQGGNVCDGSTSC